MEWIDEAKHDGKLFKVIVNGNPMIDYSEEQLFKLFWPNNDPDFQIEAI